MLATLIGTVLAVIGPFTPIIGAVTAGIFGIYLLLICVRQMRKIVVGPEIRTPARA